MRRFVAVLVVALAVPSMAAAGTTLRFVEKDAAFHYVDNPPKAKDQQSPPSPGDQFNFSETILRANKPVGHLYVSCVATSAALSQCSGIYVLPGGTLVASGPVDINLPRKQVPIVAGTGRYAGMKGMLVTVSRSQDGNLSDDTITLK